jgi:hypothetical protein
MLQMASEPAMLQNYDNDLDLLLMGDPNAWTKQILERCKQIIERAYTPRLYQQGNVDFQVTRGFLGVSL